MSQSYIALNSKFSFSFKSRENEQFKAIAKLGNMSIIDSLLPQLIATSLFPAPIKKLSHTNKAPNVKNLGLDQIDSHVLLETRQLIEQVEEYCNALTIDKRVEFNIQISKDQFSLNGRFPEQDRLCQLLNNTNEIIKSFNWLEQNYLLLTYTQEVIEFSLAYRESKTRAAQQYAYLSSKKKGRGSIFSLVFRKGEVGLQIKTPINTYWISS